MNAINFYGNKAQEQVSEWWNDQETLAICFAGGKGSGKGYLSVALIFMDAEQYPGTCYFIASQRLSDLRKYTHASIEEILTNLGISAKYYGQDNYWKLPNGSRVFYIEAAGRASDPAFRRFGTIQMTKGLIENAQAIESGAFHALWATVGRWKNKDYGVKGKLLITCVPSTESFVFNDFYFPHLNGLLPIHKKFVQSLYGDNDAIDPAFFEALEKILTKDEYRRLVLGEWISPT